jgi:hypothetical protein
MSKVFRLSREVYVPQVENGMLHYIVMEIVAASDTDRGWALKDAPMQAFPMATGPMTVSFTASDDRDSQAISVGGFQDT